MSEYRNILIIGAGIAGKLLKEDIEKNVSDAKIIGFVDDQESTEEGLDVIGKIEELSKLNKIYKIDEIIIAIPSANGELMRKILLNSLKNRTQIRLVPRSQHVIGQNDVKYSDVKDFALEDFLGRPFLKQNVEKLKDFYKNKTAFITGGAGSIGSEIVRQLFDLGVKKVIVYDNSEYLIFNIDQNLKEKAVSREKYRLVIGSILNKEKMSRIIKEEQPDFVFHAAAYKHVYLMEDNIDEAVLNNVIGTRNVVDAAIENEIKNFIFISTDKVVNPTSIMGSTKKLAEYYIKCIGESKTKFNIVRFGNVINSNGSVLPLFERQIAENRLITVTHKEVRRFFMSIREAAQLVVTSVARDNHGEIYILDMGELINIYETALCLIRTKNLIPEEDVKINIIGLKEGEKMIEELFTEKEMGNLIKTEIDNVFQLKNHEECPMNIVNVIADFEELLKSNANQDQLKTRFMEIFPSLKKK
ncbi:MAG: Polysaccharide biosynthesis protein CapD [uncultured bacterium]|nr:MAG: Polysaccharide biosynthesis protein CapD [uncultured bacterium]